ACCRWRPRENCAITAKGGRGAANITGSGPSCNEFAMTLPLMPAGTGRRRRRRIAHHRATWAVLLAVLVLGIASAAVRAEETDSFAATVAVDATADTVAKARDMARTEGQRRALVMVAASLAGAPAKPPKLDDKAIADLV